MFSKEESKRLRQEFWTAFGKSFPRKWTLYNTGIRDLNFKFHFDTKKALVALDVESNDLEERIKYWERLESLKAVLKESYLPEAVYDDSYFLENGKEISRIYVLKENVSIHNKNTWQETMVFFVETMNKFEEFFDDFKEFLKK
ncbi:DUF4268 domain-containing protein [Robertkochia aurantiaca]|uniref:DUF4268 domain-containing protein n=1 Tax=Robertkochia aurantiaca TaxID=2873700 RepID=UPI001CCD5D26|nr:DUF4268 domain-containing protein [Robertkochia sp. 3YJGBD-33]